MPSYISSNANRFYCGLEASYGQVPRVSSSNRFSAVKLATKQQREVSERKDKTGSRTFAGFPAGGRKRTEFDLQMYLSTWSDPSGAPAYGPLFQAALGATPLVYAGGTTGSSSSASRIGFSAPHGLAVNQAISFAGEIRFVASLADSTSVILNAPFSSVPSAGASIGRTITYLPASELPSTTLFDYWTPASAVQRILCGAAVDEFSLTVNGDYHDFRFRGIAQDLLDSASFTSGDGQLTAFPTEVALGAFDQSIVPGHLGQAWFGSAPNRFLTLTDATVSMRNDLDTRNHEFGTALPRGISPGKREVSLDFSLFEQDDSDTAELYQAARQSSPVPVMLQLGQVTGQLFGVYMKSVIPEVPEFDDGERRLQWKFQKSRAQGTADDEIAVAFA